MKYSDFEHIISAKRMSKYVAACGGDTRRAMTLYRLNLRLSQEMFTLVSCFEVALRNSIDREMIAKWGNDWLRDFVLPGGGFFNRQNTARTCKIIGRAYQGLLEKRKYTHEKLLAEMDFGVWKYMFSSIEYKVTGQILLRAFPQKPRSSKELNINHSYIFEELNDINNIRNRIAHHEPICFNKRGQLDTSVVESVYKKMMELFSWLGINSESLLYGLDHVKLVCGKINALK